MPHLDPHLSHPTLSLGIGVHFRLPQKGFMIAVRSRLSNMTLSIAVLTRTDGPYYIPICDAIQVANNLQNYFKFDVEDAGWLPKESKRAPKLADGRFRAVIKRKKLPAPLIVITSVPLRGDNFSFEYRDYSVISVHDWEESFAPPPLKIYLAYQLAYIAAIIGGNLIESQVEEMQHRLKGCVFDETCGAKEFRVSLVGAHLCGRCEARLSDMMLPDEGLEAINEILGYVRGATIRRVRLPATGVMIGHGGKEDWKTLRDFLRNELRCSVIEFNSDPVAGISTGERIFEMLDHSKFAFLIMTAEDQQADGAMNARQNVIHEIGLCQGRLGFRRAVIIKEDQATEFSNIKGLTYIGFKSGAIGEAFPEVVQTLVREGLVDAVLSENVLLKLKSQKPGASTRRLGRSTRQKSGDRQA